MGSAFNPPASCQTSLTQWHVISGHDILGPYTKYGDCFPSGNNPISPYTNSACPSGYISASKGYKDDKDVTLCCPRSVFLMLGHPNLDEAQTLLSY